MKLGIYKLSVLKKSPPYYSWSEFLCCYPPQAVVRQAGFGRQCLSHLLQPSQQILALGRRQLPGSQCPHLGSRPCRPPGPLSLVSPQPQLILCFFSTHSPSSVGQIWEDQEENSCCAVLALFPVPCSSPTQCCPHTRRTQCLDRRIDRSWTGLGPSYRAKSDFPLCLRHVGVCDVWFLTMQCFPILNDGIFCTMFFNF